MPPTTTKPTVRLFQDIPGSVSWVGCDSIDTRHKQDQAYRIKDADGAFYYLQLSEKTQYDRKKNEFMLLEQLYHRHFPVPRPIRFGVDPKGQSVYLLRDWVLGQNARTVLHEQDPIEQYALGHELGLALGILHQLQPQVSCSDWTVSLDQEIERLKGLLSPQDLRLVCINRLLAYLSQNRSALVGRPKAVIHGSVDFDHIILTREQALYLIDFDTWRYADPLYDLSSVITDISPISRWFATGVLDCYFQYAVSTRVFRLIACYAALRALQVFVCDSRRGPAQRQQALAGVQQLIRHYQNMTQIVPVWYQALPHIQPRR